MMIVADLIIQQRLNKVNVFVAIFFESNKNYILLLGVVLWQHLPTD